MVYDPDEWEDPDDFCDHDYWDSDILTGMATCERCGERRMLSNEEMQAQAEHEAAYQRLEAQWNRWRWWRDLKDWLRSIAPRQRAVSDDEIPF